MKRPHDGQQECVTGDMIVSKGDAPTRHCARPDCREVIRGFGPRVKYCSPACRSVITTRAQRDREREQIKTPRIDARDDADAIVRSVVKSPCPCGSCGMREVSLDAPIEAVSSAERLFDACRVHVPGAGGSSKQRAARKPVKNIPEIDMLFLNN